MLTLDGVHRMSTYKDSAHPSRNSAFVCVMLERVIVGTMLEPTGLDRSALVLLPLIKHNS